MHAMSRSTLLLAMVLSSVPGCKARQGSNLNEISSGSSGSGDGQKNCEELFYEVERYQPKFNETFDDFVATQCEMVALSDAARKEGKAFSTATTPTPGNTGSGLKDDEGRDFANMKLTEADGGSPLESLGMKPDPKFVQLVDPKDPAKTQKCQNLKKYLEEKTIQLASLKTEVGARCSKGQIKDYLAGKREYKIIDHPTCGYFSRCDDAFAETNGLKCGRCWLDTYKQNIMKEPVGAAMSKDNASTMKKYSSLTCSNEQAARDAVELFCNNIKPGACTGPDDPKIKCEAAPARDLRYEGPKELSGGAFKSWEGTEQSYQFATKFELRTDINTYASGTVDALVGEASVKIKVGASTLVGTQANMSLRVKSEVGILTLAPPSMVNRGGVEEGALNTKFSCGIEVIQSKIETLKDGMSGYVDVSFDDKATLKDPTGITNNGVAIGVAGSAIGSGGFDRAESKGLNSYRAFQSQYLSGAGMTKEGMQAACDRYNSENMALILSQFLSSEIVKFTPWVPKAGICRENKDCPRQAGGWSFRCELPNGKTIGQCRQKAYYGMSCPQQFASAYPCDPELGCKLKSWTSFVGWNFNKKHECWPCDKRGKDAEGFCKMNHDSD